MRYSQLSGYGCVDSLTVVMIFHSGILLTLELHDNRSAELHPWWLVYE